MKTYTKPAEHELRSCLTPEQYHVTQEDGTERPFQNEYWDNKEAGIYVDVVTGEPLFSSLDKYDSGTGWPSFTRPLEPANIVTRSDRKLLFYVRTEVRSKHGDSHLGHVFDDGPAPTGQRFCMNSASLRFIPLARLEEEGYGQYLPLFGKQAAGEARGDAPAAAQPEAAATETATFAGGCFWGMEELLREIPGVLDTTVGYTGGTTPNATYEIVKTGRSGHAESVQIVFDPRQVSYEALLEFFFRMHDPTTRNRQGNDIGSQYRSAIFYHSEAQRQAAEQMRDLVNRSGKWRNPVVTEIVPAATFYPAEAYHQDYLQKHPGGYTCHWMRNWTYREQEPVS